MNSDRSEQRQLFGRECAVSNDVSPTGAQTKKTVINIKETERNTGLSKKPANIIAIVEEELRKIDNSKEDITKQQGTLLYQLRTKVRTQCLDNTLLVVRVIISEGIKSKAQVSAALDYLLTSTIREVSKVIGEHRERLLTEGYTFNTGKLMDMSY
ncbi:hypothetical protein DICVIV_13378 [Dictyocaulus viviparus]|uniref:Glutaminyl-tRNA synthetase class Ib non-specific RNA-binding domain-containing protein n=1 Tax=Dictyocaulus viviparus TaxID=29172 RepID=A0A0D8X7X5_DICVI|nr:hypothetical protein DICVIV_13378 [Dictyocaulus viviparus]